MVTVYSHSPGLRFKGTVSTANKVVPERQTRAATSFMVPLSAAGPVFCMLWFDRVGERLLYAVDGERIALQLAHHRNVHSGAGDDFVLIGDFVDLCILGDQDGRRATLMHFWAHAASPPGLGIGDRGLGIGGLAREGLADVFVNPGVDQG